MSRTSFVEFLVSRNRDFINLYNSESALGLVETIRGGEKKADDKKHCVVVSFDPPLNSPPIVFNWGSNDVWYLKNATINENFFNHMDDHIDKSETPYVIFLERHCLAHKRKIQRFIKNYRDQKFRNRPLEQMPKFILAEYKTPMSKIKLTELVGGPHDTLLS
ncbi:hypothetical protein ACJVC5_16290 [Peredibacter sp. HCB2-198]|uniref:hypothetical protein n=1 Tax=Peredibacter sp. HCB2-198 TaxID=3383025 RepID=UPI0038B5BB00